MISDEWVPALITGLTEKSATRKFSIVSSFLHAKQYEKLYQAKTNIETFWDWATREFNELLVQLCKIE